MFFSESVAFGKLPKALRRRQKDYYMSTYDVIRYTCFRDNFRNQIKYFCGLKHQSTISTHFKQSLEEKVTRFKANQEKVEVCRECALTVLP